MRKILMLLLTAAMCLTACGKDAPLPEVPVEPEVPPAAATPEAAPVSLPAAVEDPEPVTSWEGVPEVTLSLLQESYPVGVREITLVLDNQSEMELCYDESFSCQRFADGVWQEIALKEQVFFRDILYGVHAGSVCTVTLNMELLEQTLEEGLYRLTGDITCQTDSMNKVEPWQLDFRVTAEAQPEANYAMYISKNPIPTVDGCLVTDRLPVYLTNNTGEDGQVLHIPHLERRNEAGGWEEIPYQDNVGFCGTPDSLPAGGAEWSEDMLYLWGALEDGRYRLSYKVGDTFDTEERAYGEFTLYTPEENHGLPLAE